MQAIEQPQPAPPQHRVWVAVNLRHRPSQDIITIRTEISGAAPLADVIDAVATDIATEEEDGDTELFETVHVLGPNVLSEHVHQLVRNELPHAICEGCDTVIHAIAYHYSPDLRRMDRTVRVECPECKRVWEADETLRDARWQQVGKPREADPAVPSAAGLTYVTDDYSQN